MATKHPRARLQHIQDEIEALQVAFDGVTFETFLDSYVLRRTADRLPELGRVVATMIGDLDR